MCLSNLMNLKVRTCIARLGTLWKPGWFWMSFLHTCVGMTGTGRCDLPGSCSRPEAVAAQRLSISCSSFQTWNRWANQLLIPRCQTTPMAVSVPWACPRGMGQRPRGRGATTDCEMTAPSHLLPGDSLARGAVGDLIRQLISLLLGVSAGSLRWGKFLNKLRPWLKLWLLTVSSSVKSDTACSCCHLAQGAKCASNCSQIWEITHQLLWR